MDAPGGRGSRFFRLCVLRDLCVRISKSNGNEKQEWFTQSAQGNAETEKALAAKMLQGG